VTPVFHDNIVTHPIINSAKPVRVIKIQIGMNVYERIVSLLDSNNVAFQLHEHEPVRTVAEVEAKLPFLLDKMLKTVAFRLKDGRIVLAGLRGHDRIDYRQLAAHFGVNRRAVASLSPEAVEAKLGFEVGGVGPFALQPGVVVLLDAQLAEVGTVYCGSGRNTVTLAIDFADLLRMSGSQLVNLARVDD
jgi:Cys-tRNA(Pro)/Cys-tRNA(Cys) deacylase